MPQIQNQHNLQPLTWEQCVTKAKQLFRRPLKGPVQHDWMKIFCEWAATEPSEFKNATKWARSKYGVTTLQKRGGRQFWNESRWAFREKGLVKAIEKTPDLLAKKFEKQLRIVGKLEDVIEKAADKLMKEPVEPEKPPEGATPEQLKQYDIDFRDYKRKKEFIDRKTIKDLAEATAKLAETNIQLSNDGVQRHEVKSVNLVAAVVESIKNRDAKFGITD